MVPSGISKSIIDITSIGRLIMPVNGLKTNLNIFLLCPKEEKKGDIPANLPAILVY